MSTNKTYTVSKDSITIALAGILNCGKSTLFNKLTKGSVIVGNFPGATVQIHKGHFKSDNIDFEIIDLPGIYSLKPDTEEQRLTHSFICEQSLEERNYDFIINVIDATNFTQSLRFTLELLSKTKNVIILLSKTDVAKKEGIEINVAKLSEELGIEVTPINSSNNKSIAEIKQKLALHVEQLHDDSIALANVPDVSAEETYKLADKIYSEVVKETIKEKFSDKVDRIILHKIISIPFFLLAMFFIFWFAIGFGGIFVDTFDSLGEYLFIKLPKAGLNMIGSSDIINSIFLSVGTGLQTLATFIPVLFFLFMTMAILKATGLMSRLAIIADRFMRGIGLPGNAFIPLLIGFGCTVPAVYGTRALSSKREKYLTIFMAPFMSCGARLPVYVLFCAFIFGEYSALIVLSIYLIGILVAVITGLVLKGTLFKGEQKPFITTLPAYILPNAKAVSREAWIQLKQFVKGAASIIVMTTAILSVLESVNLKLEAPKTPGSSILANIGKGITPIFEPMGISSEMRKDSTITETQNWQASVALFTGLFAKEVIIVTLNSLYGDETKHADLTPNSELKWYHYTMHANADSSEVMDLHPWHAVKEALSAIPDGFLEIFTFDIWGVFSSTDSQDVTADLELSDSTIHAIPKMFNKHSAYAYILFILMYFPCFVVVAASKNEMGWLFTVIMLSYTTLVAWCSATLYYQFASSDFNVLYIGIAVSILLMMYYTLMYIAKLPAIDQQLKD